MDELGDRAREAMKRLGERGRTTRIPDDVREAVLVYAKRERSRGVGWAEIAKEVGVSGSVLIRWTKGRRRHSGRSRGRLVPVRLLTATPARGGVVLIAPSGHRIEGLSVGEAVEILRALG